MTVCKRRAVYPSSDSRRESEELSGSSTAFQASHVPERRLPSGNGSKRVGVDVREAAGSSVASLPPPFIERSAVAISNSSSPVRGGAADPVRIRDLICLTTPAIDAKLVTAPEHSQASAKQPRVPADVRARYQPRALSRRRRKRYHHQLLTFLRRFQASYGIRVG